MMLQATPTDAARRYQATAGAWLQASASPRKEKLICGNNEAEASSQQVQPKKV